MLFVFPGTAYHAKRRGVFNPSENKTLANSEGAVKYRLSDGQNYPKELSDRRIISDEVSDRRIKQDELSNGANYPKITTDQVVGLGAVSATCCSLIIAETALKRILAEKNLQRRKKNICIIFPHNIVDVLNVQLNFGVWLFHRKIFVRQKNSLEKCHTVTISFIRKAYCVQHCLFVVEIFVRQKNANLEEVSHRPCSRDSFQIPITDSQPDLRAAQETQIFF